MNQSDIRRLNQRFAQAFGRPDGSQSKYKWCRTADLQYFLKTGTAEQKTPSGIYFVSPVYKRKTWADRVGNTWMIAQWKAPEMSYDAWIAAHGTTVPYPAVGRYLPIEGTELPLGMEPSDDLTQMAVFRIREQMEKTEADFVSEDLDAASKAIASAKREWEDIVDSQWPAFDSVPGMKLHASFPTPQKQIIQPAAE